MRDVYQVTNVNGTALFASKADAEAAARSRPREWGSAVGMSSPHIRAVRVFDSVDEWHRYSGHGAAWTTQKGD